jgi:hypothetical protein
MRRRRRRGEAFARKRYDVVSCLAQWPGSTGAHPEGSYKLLL